MALIISAIWVFSITGLLVLVSNKKFEICLPISIVFGALWLYLFGFFSNLLLGYYSSYIFVLLFVALFVFRIKNKEKLFIFLKNYFTIGFFIFSIILVYFFLLTRFDGFNFWDELRHWGPMVKEMFRLDKFYCVVESKLIKHKDYPPFFSLIELLWCYFRGVYKESSCYCAMLTFSFSLLLPIISGLKINKKQDWLKGFVFGISIILLFLTISKTPTGSDNARFFNSIYVDWPLAILSAYCFVKVGFIFNKNELELFDYFELSILFVALLLSKQSAIAFYCLALLLAFVFSITNKYNNKKTIVYLLLSMVIIPLLFKFSWSRFISQFPVDNQFNISQQINIFEIPSIINGTAGEKWQYDSFVNFINAIKTRTLVMSPFNMTYFTYSLVLSLVILVILKFKKCGFIVSGIYLFGSFAYGVMMLLLYVCSFGPSEGPSLASFDRYMLTYLLYGNAILLSIVFYTLINREDKSKNIAIYLVVPLILFFFIEKQDIKYLVPEKEYNGIGAINEEYKYLVSDLSIIEDDKNVMVVSQYFSGMKYVYLQYEYLDYDVAGRYVFQFSEESFENVAPHIDDFHHKEEWKDYLKNVDYIYLDYPDKTFIDNYWDVLAGDDLIKRGIYRVLLEDGQISLKMINNPH